MPSVCHEGVAERVNRIITDWLTALIEGRFTINGTPCSEVTRQTVENVEPAGSGEVEFEYRRTKYHPDVSFRFREPRFPALVIEVAWSQPFSDLQRKAIRYIQYSRGDIRTVVGLCLNDIYQNIDPQQSGRGRATFSVWRSEFDTATGRATAVLTDEEVCMLLSIIII